MNYLRCRIVLGFLVAGTAWATGSADIYNGNRAKWLSIAETCKPELLKAEKKPSQLVTIESDSDGFQGWKVLNAGSVKSGIVVIIGFLINKNNTQNQRSWDRNPVIKIW